MLKIKVMDFKGTYPQPGLKFSVVGMYTPNLAYYLDTNPSERV